MLDRETLTLVFNESYWGSYNSHKSKQGGRVLG
jgi:hypothetical protein